MASRRTKGEFVSPFFLSWRSSVGTEPILPSAHSGTASQRQPSAAPPDDLTRRPRAEKNQSQPEYEFRRARHARNPNDSACFDQNALAGNRFLSFVSGQRPIRTNQGRDRDGNQDDSDYGVERDLHGSPVEASRLRQLSRESSRSSTALHYETQHG